MTKKFNYGIKVSKRGFDVTDTSKPKSKKAPKKRALPSLLSSLALPYLFGAEIQVRRYCTAASTLKTKPVLGTIECLHEASTLFEDLNTVAKYMEMCGKKYKIHRLWLDVRDHIRHDIREEYDKENKTRKNLRANKLGIDPKLQTNIGFSTDAIKIGKVVIQIKRINSYLDRAEITISKIINRGRGKGFVKNE